MKTTAGRSLEYRNGMSFFSRLIRLRNDGAARFLSDLIEHHRGDQAAPSALLHRGEGSASEAAGVQTESLEAHRGRARLGSCVSKLLFLFSLMYCC